MLTIKEALAVIAVIALTTVLTRALPFLIFPANKKAPAFINYLGQVLPFAMIGMLVVYCLKSVSVFKGSHALPELIAIALVVILHKWKHNLLLSIAGGTVIYMILIQAVF